MIGLGVVLLVLGLIFGVPVLARVGWVLIAVGLLLLLVSAISGAGWYTYY